MSGTRRIVAAVLLALALGLAGLGQYYFFRRREFLWDGLLWHLLAAASFLLAWRTAQSGGAAAARSPLRLGMGRPSAATALLAGGLFCSLGATLLVSGRTWNESTADAVLLWLIGVALAVAAAAWPAARAAAADDTAADGSAVARPSGRRRRLPALPAVVWLELAAVAALTLLAGALRLPALDRVPFTVGGDEAWHGLLARQVLAGELRNPFVMGYMSMPTLFYWPLSWALWLFSGNPVLGLRLPAAVAGIATVPLFYGLVRQVWGRSRAVPLLGTAFLAAYDYHVHYSRLGANNVWDPLFGVVALWGLDRALALASPAGRRRPLIVAGLALGLGYYFYTGARLLPVLLAAYAGLLWLLGRRSAAARLTPAETVRALALVALVAVIVAGPMISFALSHPDDWNARINQIGILQSGWLAREPGLTGKTTAYILAEQFLRSAGAFHVFGDRTVWYGNAEPLLGIVAGALALFGMAWALAHWRERRYFLILLWFWAVILSGGMLTESPPSSQRLVMAIPAVCLLVAVGLEQTVALGRRLVGARPAVEKVVLASAMAALAVSSIQFYFQVAMPSGRYGSGNGKTATVLGHYLRGQEPGTRAYFLGAPRIYWNFGTIEFLAPQVEGHDVIEPLSGPPGLVEAAAGRTLFIVLPERAAELDWIKAAYPGGQAREFRDAAGELHFIVYDAPY